ncbi:hypothetical protein YTPLAS18_07880 [Nitrospira sp.]|nr:hypothetical protein YTPLAS18_07880 [Nitrospira sp.]
MNPLRLVSDVVLRAVESVGLFRNANVSEELVHGLQDLSIRFTRERNTLTEIYLDQPHLLTAYLHYYLPVNLAKIHAVLREIPPFRESGDDPNVLNVLDVGAGPGTASLAVQEWLESTGQSIPRLTVTAVDRSRKALALAFMLWKAVTRERCWTGAALHTYRVDVARLAEVQRLTAREGGPFDLIVIANLLNECFSGDRDPVGRRLKIVAHLLSVLDDEGSLLIIEPALREPTRALHQLRDRLVEQGLATIYSPCLHDAPCPALSHPDDWCHEERPWQAPPQVAELDRAVGFMKDALKFSYAVLRKDGKTIVPRASDLVRIVSEPRPFKGELRMFGCGESGRRDFGRLEKERSDSNAVWDECQRGTIVRIEGSQRKDRATLERIQSKGIVEIVRSI